MRCSKGLTNADVDFKIWYLFLYVYLLWLHCFQPSQQGQLMLHGDTEYLQDRANTMQSIESTIVELGGIFQQLAHMIKEQVRFLYNLVN